MCLGDNKLDMSGALTAHFLLSDLHTAPVADDTFIADTLILAAGALIVFRRTEDTLTEESVALRLVCTVIDCLRFCHLAKGTLEYLLRRREADGNLGEITLYP